MMYKLSNEDVEIIRKLSDRDLAKYIYSTSKWIHYLGKMAESRCCDCIAFQFVKVDKRINAIIPKTNGDKQFTITIHPKIGHIIKDIQGLSVEERVKKYENILSWMSSLNDVVKRQCGKCPLFKLLGLGERLSDVRFKGNGKMVIAYIQLTEG